MDLSANYYQSLHDSNVAYQENNWLLQEIDMILSMKFNSLVEVGCGNGKFLQAVSSQVKDVTGIDWAKSPKFPADVKHIKGDVKDIEIPHAELICSGDVLEHFAEEDLQLLLPKLHNAGLWNFHIVACYDDNHSHLTIKEPSWWVSEFQKIDPAYRMISVKERKKGKRAVIISNYT